MNGPTPAPAPLAPPSSSEAVVSLRGITNRFGSQVEGIFTPNESSTAGMLMALQDVGKAGQVKFVGFDSSEKFQECDLDLHKVKLSYIDGETYVFMEEETYEQFEIAKEVVGVGILARNAACGFTVVAT